MTDHPPRHPSDGTRRGGCLGGSLAPSSRELLVRHPLGLHRVGTRPADPVGFVDFEGAIDPFHLGLAGPGEDDGACGRRCRERRDPQPRDLDRQGSTTAGSGTRCCPARKPRSGPSCRWCAIGPSDNGDGYVSAEREAAFTEEGKVRCVMRKAPKGGKLHPEDEKTDRIFSVPRSGQPHFLRDHVGCEISFAAAKAVVARRYRVPEATRAARRASQAPMAA